MRLHKLVHRSLVFGTVVAVGVALGLSGCSATEPDNGYQLGVSDAAATANLAGRQLALGRAHGCSMDAAIDGVQCWGDNSKGQVDVPYLLAPTFLAAGGDTTCAISSDLVRCWGDNSHGQLRVPINIGKPTQLAVGEAHVCAVNDAGAVRCWGDGTAGQLTIPALAGVRVISAGAKHTCALAAGGVKCWGDNSAKQVDVPALVEPTQLAAGAYHNCAVDGGKPVCWGGNTPTLLSDIPDVTGVTALASGAAHSCVIDDRGKGYCWGDSAPVLKPNELNLPTQIAVGGGDGRAHACARHLQGITCWGDDNVGQIDYTGGPLHTLHHSESLIEANPGQVWDVIVDLENYPAWNPYTIQMKSTLQVGDPMIMTVKMNELTTIDPQTEYIRLLEARKKVCWGIDTNTPEFNSGERCQWLEEVGEDRVRYITEDLIEGTANELVTALFGNDVQVGFDRVAAALKTRVESLKN